MDVTDIRILRTMGIQPFGPEPQHRDALRATHIANQLGLAAETVRERIQRMEASGLIAGYEVYPNLRHFGLETTGLLFQIPDEERRAHLHEALQPLEGLIGAHYFLTADVCVDLVYQTPAEFERRRQLLVSICGDANPSQFFSWHLPKVHRALTQLDWRIIQHLRGNARRPLPELAASLGVGYRTVKRHYDRLLEEGSMYLVPHIVPGESSGVIPFWLFFYLAPDAAPDVPQQLAKAYDAHQVHADVPASPDLGDFGMILFAGSPGEIESLRKAATRIPGVARARALVAYDATPLDAWLDDRIEAALQQATSLRLAVKNPGAEPTS